MFVCESRYWLHSLVKMETWKWETGQKQACRVCSITLKKTRGCNCCQTCSNNLLSKDWTLVYTLHIFTLCYFGEFGDKNKLNPFWQQAATCFQWCFWSMFVVVFVLYGHICVCKHIFHSKSFSGFTKNNSCGQESSFPFWELFLIFTEDEWWFHTSK